MFRSIDIVSSQRKDYRFQREGISTVFPGQGRRVVFKPLPDLDENGNPLPWRLDDTQYGIGTWLLRLPSAEFVGSGDRRISFFLQESPDADLQDIMQSPYVVLYEQVRSAQQSLDRRGIVPEGFNPDWARLVGGTTVQNQRIQGPALPRYGTTGLIKAAVYDDGEATYGAAEGIPPYGVSPTHPLPVVVLRKSALSSLISKLNEPGDIDGYKYGNPIDLSGGFLISVYQLPNQKPYTVDLDQVVYRRTASGQIVFRADLSPYADRILEKLRQFPWEKIVNLISYEEQARLLAGVFPHDLLEWAWRNNPSYLEVLGRTDYAPPTQTQVEEAKESEPEPRQESTTVASPTLSGLKEEFPPEQIPEPETAGKVNLDIPDDILERLPEDTPLSVIKALRKMRKS